MMAKIFINYRRDDVPGDARSIRDALAVKFGKQSVFMDVDNLIAGQRFDKELAKALDQCGVLVAVMGPRWMDLLKARSGSGERDYVREEIAAALKRGITVIPVCVGREGSMAPLPRAEQLPEDIRELVLHQKLDVAHERFGRDILELMGAISALRRGGRREVPWGKVTAAGVVVAMLAAIPFYGPPRWGFGAYVEGGPDNELATTASPTNGGGITSGPANDVAPLPVPVPTNGRTGTVAEEEAANAKAPVALPTPEGTATVESEARTSLDEQLQRIPFWMKLRRGYPEWYSKLVADTESWKLDSKSESQVATNLVKSVVALRRENANSALAAGPAALRHVVQTFLDHLRSMRSRSIGACYGYISKGELSPDSIEIMQTPERAMTLNAFWSAIFEASLEGGKSPVTRGGAKKSDYDLLIKELAKFGWKDEEFKVFANPRELAKQEPQQVCKMVQDWFSAHLAIPDAEVQERLIFESLKPVVLG